MCVSAMNLQWVSQPVPRPSSLGTGRRQEILLLILKCDSYIVAMASNNHSVNYLKAFTQKGRGLDPSDPPAERGIVFKDLVLLVRSKIWYQPALSLIRSIMEKNTSKCLAGVKQLFCD